MSKIKKMVFNDINLGMTNMDTGEILCTTNGTTRVFEINNSEDYDEDEIKPFCKDITFLKLFRGSGNGMKKILTNTEVATLVYISDFVTYGDCVLRKNGNANGHALTIKEMSEMLDIPYDTFRKTIYSLKKKQVIGFHSTGDNDNGTKFLTVNPYIFCRGDKVSNWIKDFYSNTEWAKIERQKTRVRV